MSNIGMAEKYRGILYILQYKKKNKKTLTSMYDQIHYIIIKKPCLSRRHPKTNHCSMSHVTHR